MIPRSFCSLVLAAGLAAMVATPAFADVSASRLASSRTQLGVAVPVEPSDAALELPGSSIAERLKAIEGRVSAASECAPIEVSVFPRSREQVLGQEAVTDRRGEVTCLRPPRYRARGLCRPSW